MIAVRAISKSGGPDLRPGIAPNTSGIMQRLRLKADGRIVELRDGQEFPLAPEMPELALARPNGSPATPDVTPGETPALPAVRDLRRRAQLTQIEFAARLGVPVETIRNW